MPRNEEATHLFTIGELAAAAGVTPRTVRFYTAEGLLPPPQSRGRYAAYTQAHLDRLRLIAQLKALYLPLRAIRERLDQLDDTGVAAELREAEQPEYRQSGAPPTQQRRRALWITAQQGNGREGGERSVASGASDGTGAAAEADTWQRVTLAPGVELHVRVPDAPDAQEFLERKVAAAKALFRSSK